MDVFSHVTADFPSFRYNGVVSMRMAPSQRVSFYGDKGAMHLTTPFNASVFGEAQLTIEAGGMSVTTQRWPGVNHYKLQVENFGRALRGEAEYPCSLEFSRGTQRMIDMSFAAAGL